MYLEVFLWTERKTERFQYDLKEKRKISEIFEFSILPYTQDWNLGNLGNFSFTSNFDSSCNSRFKKRWTEAKCKKMRYGLRKRTKTSEVSEFLILSYNQSRKLENLREFCFIYLFITLFNVAGLK